MEEAKRFEQGASIKHAAYSKGKFYFDKQLERNVFFILTLAMLLWGAVTKLWQLFG